MPVYLDQRIEVKLNKKISSYYENLGYDINQKIILVNITDLKHTSKITVKCCCDNNECRTIFYRKRSKIKSIYDSVFCKECKSFSIKYTNMKKYGVENVSQLKSVQEKRKNTNKKKYGDEIFTNTEHFKNKSRKTFQKKYNVDFPFQSQEIQLKQKKTIKDKYNVDHNMQIKEVLEKRQKTWSEKYNFNHPWSSTQIKDKIKKTNLKWRESNIDKLKITWSTYYQTNKDIINKKKKEKIECECGSIIAKGNLSDHKKTNKHIIKCHQKKKISYKC